VDEPFAAPRLELSQGDIFRAVPSLLVDQRPLVVVRRRDRLTALLHTEGGDAPPGGFTWQGHGETVVARASLALAMLMTHDCELDKDEHFRTFALIRGWETLPFETQLNILAGRRLRFFHLAPQLPDLPESYVDFRRLTTVRGREIRMEDRMLSLSDDSRAALREAFIQFVTRAEG
jgi:hypothetical protein